MEKQGSEIIADRNMFRTEALKFPFGLKSVKDVLFVQIMSLLIF